MGLLFNGTTQCLTIASCPVTVTPLTIAVWFNAPVLAAQYYPFTLSSTTASDHSLFGILGQTTSIANEASNSTASTDFGATSATAVSTNNTFHICSVFTSSISRDIYVNGANPSNDVRSSLPTSASLNSTVLCGLRDGGSTVISFFNANMFFPAIWNVALSAADILSLSKGISPRKIQPSHLVRYARLTGHTATTEPDMMNATGWTVVAAPTESANIRAYFP